MTATRLEPAALFRACDPATLPFTTTAELPSPEGGLGQKRAVEAIRFGMAVRATGYNLFAFGSGGLGKHLIVRRFLEERARDEATPSDWCYVHNFEDPQRPRALRLPPGRGVPLRRDLEHLVEELRVAIPAAFDSEDHRTRVEALEKELVGRRDQAFARLVEEAAARGVLLTHSPMGFTMTPTLDGKELDPEEFHRLPEERKETLREALRKTQEAVQGFIKQLPRWEREHRERVKQLRREITMAAVDHLIDDLRQHHADLPAVLEHLTAMQQDILENVDEFLGAGDGDAAAAMRKLLADGPSFHRYSANVLVDNGTRKGAPIVFEDRPAVPQLVGRVEHFARFGALLTDLTMIKAGALHRANGGYLIVDALKILLQPYAWDELKRALRSREIKIESVGDMLGLGSTVALQPEPIPLELKVVLVGDRRLYHLLAERDDDFPELFKVAADFDDEVARTPENHLLYAQLIGDVLRREELRPADRGAVARLIEHLSRLADDTEKLSARVKELADLLREANYHAERAGHEAITAADIEATLDAQDERHGRLKALVQEEIRRGTLLIDTTGARVGQINGLSVYRLARSSFGKPSRITARIRPGKGEILDIEREVDLGGPIHSKGTLIITGFLGARYAPAAPFALSASLVFEQSYGGVEGDSASLAELCALVSALAEVPIKQGFAVTGSVNQHGDVQPIGGANEKVEGFFTVCAERGLDGTQGVILPAANVKHLMLKRPIVEAVAAGKFHVWAVTTADEALAILTGLTPGVADESGRFPDDSVNGRVVARLTHFVEIARQLGEGREGKAKESKESKEPPAQ